MKDFISKNWKKLFYIIGGIIIAIDLFFIITTPGTIPQDFYDYGPTVESDIFDNSMKKADEATDKITDNIENSEVSNEENLLPSPVPEDSDIPSNSDLTKKLIIFGIIFIVFFALAGIIDGSGGGAKKKK